jgi:membrane-associated protease RseP (regulator of RpoE activity)
VLLLIKQRPPSLDNGCPFLDARIMAAFGDPLSLGQLPFSGAIVRTAPLPPGAAITGRVRVLRPAEAPQASTPTPAPGGAIAVAPTPMVPNVAITAPVPSETPEARRVFVFSAPSASPMIIAGATIIRTNADLRETFGVKTGVLVLDVARGSSAYASGLRGGDVIVAVGRRAVTSALSIQRAIEAADGSELPLRIIRKRKEQSLTLRW